MPTLRQDQVEDLAVLLAKPRHIHGGDPGTGKTPTICVLQAIRWRQHGIGTVWVMPMKLTSKNLEEALKWGGWDADDVVVVDGTAAQCKRQLASGAKLFIMGFTRFALCYKDLPDYVKAIDIDEFHKGFGGTDSKRTQALYEFTTDPAIHFVPMTGTLYNGKPDTVYPALQIIEPRYYATPDMFRRVHHLTDPFTGKLIGYRDLEILGEILAKHSIRRFWKDIHGPEQIVIQTERLDMSERQREAYAKFEQDAILELEQFFIDGTLPGVAFTRARQIMEHPNVFPDLRDPKLPPVDITPGEVPGKLELLELDMINAVENKTPLVIFSAMVPQQRQIFAMAQKMGMKVGLLNGDTTDTETEEFDTGFRTGRFNTLVCSPQVADCGFNWQFNGDREVDDLVFASMAYQDTAFVQACKRFERQKRSSALRVKVLAYRRSLDERILKLIAQKSVEANRTDPNRSVLRF
jgi:hypothetical protein